MTYAGNKSESEAVNYKDRKYTHSTFRHGKEVRWYDCWTHKDEQRPAFGDSLDIDKVKAFDNIFRNDLTNINP